MSTTARPSAHGQQSNTRFPSNAHQTTSSSSNPSSTSKRTHSSSNLASTSSRLNPAAASSAAESSDATLAAAATSDGQRHPDHQTLSDNATSKRRKSDQSDETATSARAAVSHSTKRHSIASAGSGSGSGSGAGGTSKVGPKRKSKVGLSGLAGDHGLHASSHGHAHGHGHGHAHHVSHGGLARGNKKSASSSALARRANSRSHLALANIANELSSLAQMEEDGHGGGGTERPSSRSGVRGEGSSSKTTGKKSSGGGTASSRSHRRVADEDDDQDEDEQSATTTAANANTAADTSIKTDDDADAGWISANSSVAHTPEYGASPTSPDSYKALEFSKKPRRKKPVNNSTAGGNGQQQQPPPLEFPTFEQRQRLARSNTEEEQNSLLSGTTPRQRESALSLAAPNKVPSSSNLLRDATKATVQTSRHDDGITTSTNASSSNIELEAETPTMEKANPTANTGPSRTVSASAAPARSRAAEADDTRKPANAATAAGRTASHHHGLEGKGHPSTSASELVKAHNSQQTQVISSPDQVSQLPQPPPSPKKSRPVAQRKSSTSTIRSFASIAGSRAPLAALTSTSFRRQPMVPLEPQLDTSAEGHGEVEHTGLTPKSQTLGGDVPFPSTTVTSPSRQEQQLQQTSGRAHHRRSGSAATSMSSKAGTLSPREAEELAKRLRTVSGSDLPGHAGNVSGNSNTVAARSGAGAGISGLRRSASSAQGTTLASLQKYGVASPRSENPPGNNSSTSGGGGALGTLKRASGYFGSIGRLTSLGSTLGLTSAGQESQAPSPTSPTTRRTPSSGGSMSGGTQSAIMKSSPVQRLQNAYNAAGARGYRGFGSGSNTVPQLRQPLISKFIDPSENYQPFAKASTWGSAQQSQSKGTSSRARQKLLTQRDYPDDPPTPTGSGGGSGWGNKSFASSSDEDPTASQINLRKNLSSKNLSASGASTPLQPGVQRWLVALSKEAERIDREHETFYRFHDTLQASFARVLERRAIEELEETRAMKEGAAAGTTSPHKSNSLPPPPQQQQQAQAQNKQSQTTSRPNTVRSRTMV